MSIIDNYTTEELDATIKLKKLKKKEIAEEIGISESHVNKIISKHRKPGRYETALVQMLMPELGYIHQITIGEFPKLTKSGVAIK